MPSINRIRVNNVKYNFGTQSYDDFTMRMYGRNTLYDLANGGGKSVLMLLLMQNLIPNCTLDDKQPIEKLFRDGSNTVIHSLIEWKLDECDIKDGYRYMTTGFAARKATTVNEETEADGQTARIDYFNYIIFYRNYNKHDIINLPLVKGDERISYKGLKNMLMDLARTDKNLLVEIYDRKGEYQRAIAEYGLYESQWEIIRGINRTEGHVRTYFETNYKTTRKVVEDLIIEEIIEKAYMTKTEREKNKTESTATLLLTIQEELKALAARKKDIAIYDHESELVELLRDRVDSCMEAYEKQRELAVKYAGLYSTLKKQRSEAEAELKSKEEFLDKAGLELENESKVLDILGVGKNLMAAETMNARKQEMETNLQSLNDNLELAKEQLNIRIASTEYIDMLRDQAKYDKLIREQKAREKALNEDEETHELSAVTFNLKRMADEMLSENKQKLKSLHEEMDGLKAELEEKSKKKAAAETELAVMHSGEDMMKDRISGIRSEIDAIAGTLIHSIIGENSEIFRELSERLESEQKSVDDINTRIEELKAELAETEQSSADGVNHITALNYKLEEIHVRAEKLKQVKSRLKAIADIYGADDISGCETLIRARIDKDVIRRHELKADLAKLEARQNELKEGRIIARTEGVRSVIDYISTRHNVMAMSGMDYISALPADTREKLVTRDPGLPYGVVTNDFEKVSGDQGIYSLSINEQVILYDIDKIGENPVTIGDGAISICKEPAYYVDENLKQNLLSGVADSINQINEELKLAEDMLSTERKDLDFVAVYASQEYLDADKEEESVEQEIAELKAELEKNSDKVTSLNRRIRDLEEKLPGHIKEAEELSEDIKKVEKILALEKSMKEPEDKVLEYQNGYTKVKTIISESEKDIERLNGEVRLTSDLIRITEDAARVLEFEWENTYKPFYTKGEYETINKSWDELVDMFHKLKGDKSPAISLDKEKMLIETLLNSLDRQRRSIEALGVDIRTLNRYHSEGKLTSASEAELKELRDKCASIEANIVKLREEIAECEKEHSKLIGSIDYALLGIRGRYDLSDMADSTFDSTDGIRTYLKMQDSDFNKCIALHTDKKNQIKAGLGSAEKDIKKTEVRLREIEELLHYTDRVIAQNHIDITNLDAPQDFDLDGDITGIYDDLLMKYDRTSKDIDRSKNDILKVKLKVVESLGTVGADELAASIRDDVNVPENAEDASKLLERLKGVLEIIALEKDRVEKSLVSMEKLKDSFIDQCLERCLDVKTEISKLAHLSEIIIGDEKIQMIKLSIPYVKDEFMKDRMSEYIDRLVAEMDNRSTESDVLKFLNQSLSMKKLFSVIVTDMSKIKLMLYKRERIVEQSRYLRYEEAVGSTGQSQGIYIQFLISIINYISGMYAITDSTGRAKTLFIDNPFGAAKDIYIWEPIFRLLEENHVQLIVPARGATPEITGRFDVNYVLGQQMVGNRTTTVVVNYTSKTKGEELEYKELDTEQMSFDFI